jgi:hypothetical protein
MDAFWAQAFHLLSVKPKRNRIVKPAPKGQGIVRHCQRLFFLWRELVKLGPKVAASLVVKLPMAEPIGSGAEERG